MDVTITNLSSSAVFLPGPRLNLAASGDANGDDVRLWQNITTHDLDSDVVLKQYVLDGVVSVSIDPESTDAAVALQGTVNHGSPERYNVADLPTGYDGRMAYAIDGRKTGEGAGLGTGALVVFSDSQWRLVSDDSQVLA